MKLSMNASSWGAALLLLFIMLSMTPEASAQRRKKKRRKKQKTVQVDSLGLSYNYGLLVGASIAMQGIPKDSLSAEEIAAGIMKALETELDPEMMDQAQERFMARMEAVQAAQAEAKLAEEKTWLADNAKNNKNIITLESGIQYEVLTAGEGEKPTAESSVTTHYHGMLTNGTVFDSSVERGQPATFPVGGVIQGWQEILQLMPTGSKWKVYIPSALGYGSQAVGNIPPNSILIFEIELLSIN
ncbi:FKBP-type peptidyl-prolyl cis-trans isomerase [Saprospira grandis]|uniref:FKBP-type peptidyl-prolyl cis-trans isomerase n=1 Tax=Saprospira grandis TaxID=1008 RepID=UPI0022DD68FB|nr:FKBP-type peptidyl-prolyl cis-trans isomerase [Saprospira grandis]WBM75165.1 FKBP-type peptidyl-prolyl cis-trans isomerase [Saprospira grandis]